MREREVRLTRRMFLPNSDRTYFVSGNIVPKAPYTAKLPRKAIQGISLESSATNGI